jgi:phage FluMu protein Com
MLRVLIAIRRGDKAKIRCNECDALIATVPVQEAQATIIKLAKFQELTGERCPHCGAINVFLGFCDGSLHLQRMRRRASPSIDRFSEPDSLTRDRLSDRPEAPLHPLGANAQRVCLAFSYHQDEINPIGRSKTNSRTIQPHAAFRLSISCRFYVAAYPKFAIIAAHHYTPLHGEA